MVPDVNDNMPLTPVVPAFMVLTITAFQIDVTGAGAGGASSAVEGTGAEDGRRWGEVRRPPTALAFDMGELTTKMLNGAIPRLSAHSYVGMSSARLLRAAGLEDVRLEVVPLLFHSREALEEIVPITYFSRVLAVNQGALSADEAELWYLFTLFGRETIMSPPLYVLPDPMDNNISPPLPFVAAPVNKLK